MRLIIIIFCLLWSIPYSALAQDQLLFDGAEYFFREEPLPHTIILGKPEVKWKTQVHSCLKVGDLNYYKTTCVFQRRNKEGGTNFISMVCYIEEGQLPDSINLRLRSRIRTSPIMDIEVSVYDVKKKETIFNHGYFLHNNELIRFDHTTGSYKLRKGVPYTFVIPRKNDTLVTPFIYNDTVAARINIKVKIKKGKTKYVGADKTTPSAYFSKLQQTRLTTKDCIVKGEGQEYLNKTLWTGACEEGFANGKGKLYEFNDIPYYAGEIKDGLMHGYGRLYDDVITEGVWQHGNLIEKKRTYYREVLISDDSYGNQYYKYHGLILEGTDLLKKSRMGLLNSENYYNNIYTDTIFNEKISSNKWIQSCANHIFHIQYNMASSFLRTTHINYFLVECKNKKLIIVSRASGKGGISWSLESNSSVTGTVTQIINTGCGCE